MEPQQTKKHDKQKDKDAEEGEWIMVELSPQQTQQQPADNQASFRKINHALPPLPKSLMQFLRSRPELLSSPQSPKQ